MAKTIRYKFATEIYHEQGDMLVLSDASIECPTEEVFNNNLPIVQAEAYNGEYSVEGEFDFEPVTDHTANELIDAMLGVNRFE